MKDKSLESIFREKLEDLRIDPSDRAKNLIQQRIKKRGRIILYRRLSIAAGIALIMSIGLFYFMPWEKRNSVVDHQVLPEDKSESIFHKDTPVQKEIPERVLSQTENERKEPGKRASGVIEPVKPNPENSQNESMIQRERPAPQTTLAGITSNKKDPADTLQLASAEIQISAETPNSQELYSLSGEEQKFSSDTVDDVSGEKEEPMKITIEYIASGTKKSKSDTSRSQLGEFYSKVNKLVYPEEVLGDIRSLKDQLFTLEFINRKSTHTQNNKEK